MDFRCCPKADPHCGVDIGRVGWRAAVLNLGNRSGLFFATCRRAATFRPKHKKIEAPEAFETYPGAPAKGPL